MAGAICALPSSGEPVVIPLAPGPGAPQEFTQADEVIAAKLAFFEALSEFRAEGLESEAALRATADHLASGMGDTTAHRIAAYYLGLSPSDRIDGFQAEGQFDEIRSAIHVADAGAEPPSLAPGDRAHAAARLAQFAQAVRSLRDQVPAARAESLIARLSMRELERAWPGDPRFGAQEFENKTRSVESAATFALAAFERAGMATPQLEPEWVLARLALIDGDLAASEAGFRRMDRLAAAAGQDTWRERALLGLVGVARDRGSPTGASAALAELATFRSPKSCWSLAREVAVQRLARDDAAAAIQWLESHPPLPDVDSEMEASSALDEWAALMAAAHLRARRPFEAQRVLDDMDAATTGNRSLNGNRRQTVLLRAALQLELGDPDGALATLATPEAIDLPAVDLHTLRGRAYLAAKQPAEAIVELESALAIAASRDEGDRRALIDASAVGEWLGLSAVADLAQAYLVCRSDAVGAASAIEAAHAGITVTEARERLLAAASSVDLGAITWVVGADSTLMIHVEASGRATHASIPMGRAAFARAIRRVRQGIIDSRDAPNSTRLDVQLQALSAALLPSGLLGQLDELQRARSNSGEDAPSLLLMSHGVLERLPFEALPLDSPTGLGRRLGTEVSLAIVTQLRPAHATAPRVNLRKARWTAVGAPDFESLPWLKGSEKELSSLGRMNPRMTVLAGQEATSAALIDALGKGRPVHVSSHVISLRDRAEESHGASQPSIRSRGPVPFGIAMSAGAVVSPAELAAARPRVPLVVLAACASGDGDSLDGASVRGLAQVALDAGTRCALLTQWPVSDQAAYHASLAFHGAVLAGAPPAEAARRARRLLHDMGRPMAEWSAYRLSGAW